MYNSCGKKKVGEVPASEPLAVPRVGDCFMPEQNEIRSLVLDATTPEKVLREIPACLNGGLSEAEFLHVGGVVGAVWKCGGDPKLPHVELSDGDHSDGYYNMSIVLSYPNLRVILAEQLAKVLKDAGIKRGGVDWVVGSDHAGAAVVIPLGELLNARSDFCTKGPGKTQVWNRHEIGEDERVLHVEELIKGLTTSRAVRCGVREHHARPVNFVPVTGTIVHRPAPDDDTADYFEDGRVVSVFRFPTESWDPDNCPLCDAGSPVLRATKANWPRLMHGQ